jgi:hypothetical protein
LLTDYENSIGHSLPNFVNMRMAAQTMASLAKAYLELREPEKAMRYINGIHRLMNCFENDPTLVGAMIHVAITGLYVDTIQFGFPKNIWRDEELREIQQQLSQIKCLPAVVHALRAERAAILDALERTSFREMYSFSSMGSNPFTRDAIAYFKSVVLGIRFNGSREKNLLNFSKMTQYFAEVVDKDAERIFPQQCVLRDAELQTVIANESAEYILISIALPNYTKAFEGTAKNQTRVNQCMIVCALERYRLAYGHYATTLNELSPVCLDQLPHDIIGGQPLLYQRPTPETFLLYSVGWDETDDKGSTNDWVWGSAK